LSLNRFSSQHSLDLLVKEFATQVLINGATMKIQTTSSRHFEDCFIDSVVGTSLCLAANLECSPQTRLLIIAVTRNFSATSVFDLPDLMTLAIVCLLSNCQLRHCAFRRN
jgi:hypothetical protein